MSDSLQPHILQQAKLPCPSFSPRVCSNSCPLSQWFYLINHLILCFPLPLLPSIFASIRVFCNESTFHICWPKYWSFSVSPSNEYFGLISFRISWFVLLAVQGTLSSLLQHQFENINSLELILHYDPTLTSINDYWEKTIALTIKVYRPLSAKWCL